MSCPENTQWENNSNYIKKFLERKRIFPLTNLVHKIGINRKPYCKPKYAIYKKLDVEFY